MRIKWYSKGKLSDPVELPEIIVPYLKIVKYEYSDEASYNGYRYFILDNRKKNSILLDLNKEIFETFSGRLQSLTEDEFILFKKDEILISNAKTSIAPDLRTYKWTDLLGYYPKEAFYI